MCKAFITAPDGRGEMPQGGNELKVWDMTAVGKLPDTEEQAADMASVNSAVHCEV